MSKKEAKSNFSKFKQFSCATLLTVALSIPVASISVSAAETSIAIPKDSLNSVMWDFMAKEHLLTDKNSKKIVMNSQILVHTPKVAEDQLNLPFMLSEKRKECPKNCSNCRPQPNS